MATEDGVYKKPSGNPDVFKEPDAALGAGAAGPDEASIQALEQEVRELRAAAAARAQGDTETAKYLDQCNEAVRDAHNGREAALRELSEIRNAYHEHTLLQSETIKRAALLIQKALPHMRSDNEAYPAMKTFLAELGLTFPE